MDIPKIFFQVLSCIVKFAPNIIKTNKATHENMHTNTKTCTYRLQEFTFKATQTYHIFHMCFRISKHEK